jgi:hypothetical protein
MARKTRTTTLVWFRRAVQSAFLLLFLYLFLETAYHPINRVGGGIKLFFQLDPLVVLTDWLASHALAAGMLLSVATLAVTFLFGRWFCGWICPFGTVHQLFSSLRGGSVKPRLESGGYGRWQKVKYYVLVVFLAGALLGVNVVGWLDPISFFFRGMAVAVHPAVNAAMDSILVYDSLRRHFLAFEQPHYFGNVLVGVLMFVRSGRCWGLSARTRWCGSIRARKPATVAACAWPIARAAPTWGTPSNGNRRSASSASTVSPIAHRGRSPSAWGPAF